jgi:hypothetical protein
MARTTKPESSSAPVLVNVEPRAHHHGLELDYATTISESAFLSPVIAGFFSGLLARQRTPWLVVVIRFKDDPPIVVFDELPNGKKTDVLAHQRRLFTKAGTGSMNMVDSFLDNSHGKIDVSDSEVVGVYTIPYKRADYIGNVAPQPGKINRGGVLEAGRAAASAHKIDLTVYSGVVVCGYTPLDLCGWVGGMAALCDLNSLSPDLLGQEMGHGYGSDHSGLDGSTVEYGDPWDTMSTWSPYSAPNADYSRIGPGLNAVNMRLRGWLNEDRVVVIPPTAPVTRDIVLGPLHDRGLQAAALDVAGFLIEVRIKNRWDAGIPRSCVLVHRAQGNRSYLMAASDGANDLVAGSVFKNLSVLGPSVTVTVTSIDERTRRATLRVEQTVRRIRIPDEAVPEWPPHLGDPGPVERLRNDPRISRLRDRFERYAAALEIADHFGTPDLALRSLAEIAEEIGRQTARVEVTTFHEGYSFHDGFAQGTGDVREPNEEHDHGHHE